ncbi:hypothetical protein ABEV54_18645 [Peribacillus psychrosaccharolyticus]|uniref:hypothetical protein n=1 Tax=Peribacillus psychrosaccharolyticus TaxID=1407 RepID=UPI003D2654CB
MEVLIDFFIRNPWLLIIVIGIVTSLSGKKKKPEQEQTPNRPARPQQQPTVREVYRQAMQEMTEASKPPVDEASMLMEEELARNQEHKAELERAKLYQKKQKQLERIKAAKPVLPIEDNSSPIYNTNLQFDQQRLVDGIIMSEVLGQPRARKNMYRSGVRR